MGMYSSLLRRGTEVSSTFVFPWIAAVKLTKPTRTPIVIHVLIKEI